MEGQTMPSIMALLAIAFNRQLPNTQELKVDVVEAELIVEALTPKFIESLSHKLLDNVYKLNITIENQGKRAKVIHTLESGKTEELQIYLFHTQVIQKQLLQ